MKEQNLLKISQRASDLAHLLYHSDPLSPRYKRLQLRLLTIVIIQRRIANKMLHEIKSQINLQKYL